MAVRLCVTLWITLSLAPLAGCSSAGGTTGSVFLYKNLPIADGSAMAGDGHTVLYKGTPSPLTGIGIRVGDPLREAKLAQTDLSLINIADTKGVGKVRIISVVPSLDTKVCEQQTHALSERNKGLDKMVELISISIDTPFAQKRFAEEAKIRNVTFLSDYREVEFGKAYGLFLKDPHLLTRAIMVVDSRNTVRYLQITPELAQLPDMDEAFKFARSLIRTN